MSVSFADLDALRARLDAQGETGLPPEGESAQYLAAVRDAQAANPLLQSYAEAQITSIAAKRPFVNEQAWMAAAERAQVVWALAHGMYDLSEMTWDKKFTDDEIRCVLIFRLQAAAVYLWKDEIHKLTDSMPVPRHVVSRNLLPHPMMFFSFQRASPLKAPGFENRQTNWVLLSDEGEAVSVYSDIMPLQEGPIRASDGGVEISGGHIKYGDIFPDSFGEEHQGAVRQNLAWLAFVNSPYVNSKHVPVERHMRRRVQRNGFTGTLPEVSVITLRRELVSKRAKPVESDGPTRTNRWWVSGHIRAQWYPSLKAHKLIWVAPYLKGPEGKPIKERVYQVVR